MYPLLKQKKSVYIFGKFVIIWGMKKSIQAFIYFLFFLGISIGITYEGTVYLDGSIPAKHYGLLVAAVAFLLIYILPLIGLLWYAHKRWQVSLLLLPIALLSGAFIAGWMSSLANQGADFIWEPLLSKKAFEDWSAALSAPFTEEPLKLLAAAFPLYFFGKKDLKHVLLAGAGAGLGFEIAEDIVYIQYAIIDTPQEVFYETFNRIVGAPTSHWMMTATFTSGFFLVLFYKQYLRGSLLMGLTVLFHFIWNSPFTTFETPLFFHVAIVSAFYLLLFAFLVKQVDADHDKLPLEKELVN